jgi:plastocyanin domain-containing protein
MDKIIVSILGVVFIGLTYWFFLGKKEKEVKAQGSIDILVKGGYSPSKIIIPQNETTTINFLREDFNACLEEVILSDFKIRKYLPLNQKISIEINPKKKGEFDFSCGMGMFHGKLIVE